MRYFRRLFVLIVAVALAVTVHVAFVSPYLGGSGGDEGTSAAAGAYRARHGPGSSRSPVDYAGGVSNGVSGQSVLRLARWRNESRTAYLERRFNETRKRLASAGLAAAEGAANGDKEDELHALYRLLRRDPEAAPADVMLAQKVTFLKIPMCDSLSVINPMATVAANNVPSLLLTVVPENVTRGGRGQAGNSAEEAAGSGPTERQVVEYLYQYPTPYLCVGGHRYVDFRRHADFQPIAFTVLADPAERFVNMYHLVRRVHRYRSSRAGGAGRPAQPAPGTRLKAEAMNTSLELCAALVAAMRGDPRVSRAKVHASCGFALPSLAGALCGEDARCRPPGEDPREEGAGRSLGLPVPVTANFTLRAALRHLDDFLLVGLADQMGATVRLMERLLPFYLGGLREEFTEQYRLQPGKRSVPDPVAEQLRIALHDDYVLYDEAKERFERLKTELEI